MDLSKLVAAKQDLARKTAESQGVGVKSFWAHF
jgi:hypothetical protein